ncbi:EamA family transporter, partial [Ralstonia pseudosolanacearum]
MTRSTALPLGHAPDHAERRGLLLGFIGVTIFSQTLPFTRMAVAELDATFVALARAVLASLLALALLAAVSMFTLGGTL